MRQSEAEVRLTGQQLGLAPMEGVSDFAVRLWFHLTSRPDFAGTPFLRATATYPHGALSPKYAPELFELRDKFSYGLIPQVMASDPAHAEQAFALLLPHSPVVDLNCGCPAPTVVGHGAGSSILTSPERLHATAMRLARFAGAGRLSIKTRTGFDDDSLFDELMDAVSQAPLARLTLHGRTRAQRYTGQARWDLIARAGARLPFPVTGSGDIVNHASFGVRMAKAPLKTVIVGRGALRNPWIFDELRTGTAQHLSWDALTESLRVLALLVQLHEEKWETLLDWAATSEVPRPLGTNAEAWRLVRATLACHVDRPSSRVTLGRLKMIWTYLRTSLPEPFLDRDLLRAPTVADFFLRLASVCAQASGDGAELRHHPERDRLWRDGAAQEQTPQPSLQGCAQPVLAAAPLPA